MAKIFWLASYPKSGNTWLRMLLSNVLAEGDEPVNINQMETHGIASSKSIFEQEMGVSVADLSLDEVNQMRPDIYCSHVRRQNHDLYVKVHDAYQTNQQQQAFFPNECSGGAIYIVRHPFDVAVSFASHLGASLDVAIEAMNNPDYAFCAKSDRDHNQLHQHLGGWSEHIKSWQQAKMPVHWLRYEDMLTDTLGCFSRVAAFVGLSCSQQQLETAVEFSSIKALQKQEQAFGFKEKPGKAKLFFRKGVAGDGKAKLNKAQQQALYEAHGETMQQFNYD